MKKTILLVCALFLTGIAVVTALFMISHRSMHKYNSFVRQFPPHPLAVIDTLDIGYNSYYIAGATKAEIYLGNTTSQLHLLTVPTSLAYSKALTLRAREIDSTKFWSLRVKVDSPYFFLADGAVPRIYTGTIGTWNPVRYGYDSAYFLDFAPVSYSKIGVRSISETTDEAVLGAVSLDSPHVKLTDGLLQKQIDGRFCTDGMLHYNKGIKKFIYLYYYRNEFIVYDTSLNLIYRGKTIDTISTAQVKIASISSANTFTHAAPPLLVNKNSFTNGRLLFVHSALIAKNESREAFESNSVIDVYDLVDNEYRFSFYISNFNGIALHDFHISGNKLIALVDKYLITYELAPQYFGDGS